MQQCNHYSSFRKELKDTGRTFELVVIIARSHVALSADVCKKRKERGITPQREHNVFDYVENEFMLKVSLFHTF